MSVFHNHQEVVETYQYLLSKAEREDSCRCIVIGQSNRYVDVKYTIPCSGRHVRTKAHQVALLLRLGTTSPPTDTEASHLCNKKNCVSARHLSAEPHSINMDRSMCFRERDVRGPGFCHGHGSYPNCI